MKKGFTLAEVLITLGIIGVITALTMPVLSTATQDKANANRLSSTVTDLENAFGIMLTSEDEDSLDNILTSTTLNAELTPYMKTAGAGGTIAAEYGAASPFKGTNGQAFTVTADSVLKVRNGALVFLHKNSTAANADANGNVDRYYGDLVIDVNGSTGPNKVNKDLYVYHLGTDGMLYRSSVTTGNP